MINKFNNGLEIIIILTVLLTFDLYVWDCFIHSERIDQCKSESMNNFNPSIYNGKVAQISSQFTFNHPIWKEKREKVKGINRK